MESNDVTESLKNMLLIFTQLKFTIPAIFSAIKKNICISDYDYDSVTYARLDYCRHIDRIKDFSYNQLLLHFDEYTITHQYSYIDGYEIEIKDNEFRNYINRRSYESKCIIIMKNNKYITNINLLETEYYNYEYTCNQDDNYNLIKYNVSYINEIIESLPRIIQLLVKFTYIIFDYYHNDYENIKDNWKQIIQILMKSK